MKTVILNTFTSFATFPMFNPAYLKGPLLRAGIENKHIDINQKPFLTTFNVFGLMLDSPMYEKPDQFGIIETHDDDTKFNMIQVPYKTIYDDDTSNPLVINNLSQWIGLYTSILVNQESLIPLWMSIADTPFEFLLKKYYTHNPFLKS